MTPAKQTRISLLVFCVGAFTLTSCFLVGIAADNSPIKQNAFVKNLIAEDYFDGLALELARAIDREDVAELRRQAPRVELNKVYKRNATLLFYALTSKHYAAVTELIKAGANPQQKDSDMGSPLDLAARMEDAQALESLLNGGVSPDSTNSWGTPLLFSAACLDSMDSLRLLVFRKANLDAKDQGLGRTAAFHAFSSECYDQVEFLFEQGADVRVTLVNGVTLPYSLQRRLETQKLGTPAYEKLTKIKRLMQERGVKFPADAPPVVRAQMKAKGLKVAE